MLSILLKAICWTALALLLIWAIRIIWLISTKPEENGDLPWL